MRQFLKATGSESGLVADFENGPTVRFGNGSEPGTGRALGGHQPDVRLDIVDDGAQRGAQALQRAGTQIRQLADFDLESNCQDMNSLTDGGGSNCQYLWGSRTRPTGLTRGFRLRPRTG